MAQGPVFLVVEDEDEIRDLIAMTLESFFNAQANVYSASGQFTFGLRPKQLS